MDKYYITKTKGVEKLKELIPKTQKVIGISESMTDSKGNTFVTTTNNRGIKKHFLICLVKENPLTASFLKVNNILRNYEISLENRPLKNISYYKKGVYNI